VHEAAAALVVGEKRDVFLDQLRRERRGQPRDQHLLGCRQRLLAFARQSVQPRQPTRPGTHDVAVGVTAGRLGLGAGDQNIGDALDDRQPLVIVGWRRQLRPVIAHSCQPALARFLRLSSRDRFPRRLQHRIERAFLDPGHRDPKRQQLLDLGRVDVAPNDAVDYDLRHSLLLSGAHRGLDRAPIVAQ